MNEFLHHYREIMLDPAHMMAELTQTLVIEGMLLGIIWPLIIRPLVKRMVRKEHLTIDAEHGVINHGAPPRAWVAPRGGGYTPPDGTTRDPQPPPGPGAVTSRLGVEKRSTV